MKRLIILVSLILFGLYPPKDNLLEKTSLAETDKLLSLQCPDYLPSKLNINATSDLNKPFAGGESIKNDWYSEALNKIRLEEYNITYSEESDAFQSPNRANNIQFVYHKNGFTAQTRETQIPLFDVNDKTIRDEEKKYREIEKWSIELRLDGGVSEILNVSENKAWTENENLRIDYKNIVEGMRQDFIVKMKPSEEGNLNLVLNVSTKLKMSVSKDAVAFISNKDGSEKMQYSSLKVTDANGKNLEAYFEKKSINQFAICVNDEDAEYPVTIDPLSSSPDWEYESNNSNAMLGFAVSSAGDINGDGFSDVIVGAHNYSGNYGSQGKVFLFCGSSSGLSVNPTWTMTGSVNGDYLGADVSTAGDINNDGFADILIVHMRFWGVYAFYGSSTGLSNDPNWVLNIGGYFGRATKAGDVNGDGFDDIIISNGSGTVYQYYGSATGLSSNSSWSYSQHYPGYSCRSISTAGDVNGDGYSDIIIGDYNGQRGAASLFFGSATGLSLSPDWYKAGSGFDLFGSAVDCAGDVNHDGFDDVIIGEWLVGNGTGKVYVYFGSSNGISIDPDWVAYGSQNWEDFGISVAGAGDIDADGYSDIIVGAPHYINNSADTGRVYVFFGSPSGLQNSGKQVLTCDNYTAHFGNAVSSAGDVNGDGFSDILVGAEEYSNGESKEGKAFLFYGSANIFPAQITNFFPLQNAISVNKSSDITVKFGQEMNASTINSSNIKVFGFETGLLSTSISYNPGSRTATINPVSDFKTGEKIQVTLTSGIKTSSNIQITPFTWTFSAQALSGTGVFTEARIIDSTGSSNGDQITSGDFNGDGKPDLAQMNQSPEVFIYFNDGNANFSVAQIILKNFSIAGGSIASGDYDNDGDIDLFISFIASDSVYIYKNNGSGFFTQSFAAYYNSGYRIPPVVNDYDADGDLDIISLTSDGWDINLFINDGSGNLTHSYILPDLDYTMGISSGDIDNDGDMDLITTVSLMNNSKSVILINDGNANFTIGNTYNHNSVQDFCPNADFNSDGYIDFVTSKTLYFNDGNGNFLPYDFPVGGNLVSEILSADYDADNDIDNVYIDYISDLKEYKNNGFGSFTFFQNIQPGIFPNFGISSDLDCDGDIDLIIASEGGHHWKSDISILLNNYCTHPSFSITGSSGILIGSENNLYVSSAENGYWEISNYENTMASIPPNSTGDSVLVSAGNNFGHFELYFIASYDCGGDTLLSKHVYIDNPLPVELSTFNSSVTGRNVTLSWSTNSELNNSGFDIEKLTSQSGSAIKNEWSKVSFINGNGTISEPVNYTFTDKNLSTGKYKYRLKQIDFNGNFEYFELAEEVNIGIPDKYSLSQNYPNPFNPVTNLEFGISELGFVSLKIYDVTGRELVTLVNEVKELGYYNIKFDAGNLSSGVYFYRLVVSSSNPMIAGDFTAVKKMVVLK